MHTRRLALLVVALLALAGCAGASEDAGADTAATTADPAAAPADAPSEPADSSEAPADGSEAATGLTLTTSDTELGTIVVDDADRTLYIFDNDTDGTSVCTGDCADTWPPLTGDVTAGEGVDAALVGTTERDDGTLQTTYDGQPLYYFAGDAAAGELNGQGVGEIWWVVGPDGEKITDQVGQAATSAAGGY